MKRLLATFFFCMSAIAQPAMQECVDAAGDYGKIQPPTAIPAQCYDLVIAQKNHLNFDVTSNGKVGVIGYKNLIYALGFEQETLQLQSIHPMAGANTRLNDVIALETNYLEDRLYVLNKNEIGTNILSYPLKGGNLAPYRELKTDEIANADNIKLDHANQELYVISQNEAWIKVFNLHADHDGPRPEHSMDVLRKLYGNNTQLFTPIDLAVSSNEVYVLESYSILIYAREASGDASPLRVIAGANTTLGGAKSIEINPETNILYVKNGNGELIKFPATGGGDIAPLP